MSLLDPLRPRLDDGSTANWSEERWTKPEDLAEDRNPCGQAGASVITACAADARSAAEANGRRGGRSGARPANKTEYTRMLHGQCKSYGEISAKTSIPKTSLHQHTEEGSHDV